MARIIGLLLTGENVNEEQQKPYICPHCGKEYKSAAALKAHATKTHPQVFDGEE